MTKDTEINKEEQINHTEDEQRSPRVPPQSRWDAAMDEVISEAMRNGKFDNLRGRGKPLNLSDNRFGAEYELAYGLLKNNDYTLPWIAQRQDIFDEITKFREKLQETWQLYSAEYKVTLDPMALKSLEAGWRHYLNTEVQTAISKINKKIADINLKQPREVVEIFKLSLPGELNRANASERLEQD